MAGAGLPDRERRGAGRILNAGDVVAGVGVAMVLIPQSLAYAKLAGMPAYTGLYAAALPLIAAAFLASSPYLQTGPAALTSLLTLGALVPLAAPGGADYIGLAALLALVVGATRVLVGVLRLGVIAYLMSEPLLAGFTNAAALLIIATQLPGALGVSAPVEGVVGGAVWAVTNPGAWDWAAVVLSVATVGLVLGARRMHPLVPGVLLAAALGLAYSLWAGYGGATVGTIPGRLPMLTLDLPWGSLPRLLPAGIVIALIGFAEPASIARAFAAMDRQRWNPDREFASQGMASVVAGLTGGFPVGGSFARSSLNRLAGARTRWSGAITGLVVLAFLPFAQVLAPLPVAVLSAIVIAAVAGLVRPREVIGLWPLSRPQFLVAFVTFVLTLALAPHIEWAVAAGLAVSVAVHLWRELHLYVEARADGDTLHLKPHGVLWFGSAHALGSKFLKNLAEHPDARKLVIHADSLGRVDLGGALVLLRLVREAEAAGLEVNIVNVHRRTGKALRRTLAWNIRRRPGSMPPGLGEPEDAEEG